MVTRAHSGRRPDTDPRAESGRSVGETVSVKKPCSRDHWLGEQASGSLVQNSDHRDSKVIDAKNAVAPAFSTAMPGPSFQQTINATASPMTSETNTATPMSRSRVSKLQRIRILTYLAPTERGRTCRWAASARPPDSSGFG